MSKVIIVDKSGSFDPPFSDEATEKLRVAIAAAREHSEQRFKGPDGYKATPLVDLSEIREYFSPPPYESVGGTDMSAMVGAVINDKFKDRFKK